jgi:hypothetical protein
MNNIQDVTNSPTDWEDFWNSDDEEEIIRQLMQPREEFASSDTYDNLPN